MLSKIADSNLQFACNLISGESHERGAKARCKGRAINDFQPWCETGRHREPSRAVGIGRRRARAGTGCRRCRFGPDGTERYRRDGPEARTEAAGRSGLDRKSTRSRSEEHTSELQSLM